MAKWTRRNFLIVGAGASAATLASDRALSAAKVLTAAAQSTQQDLTASPSLRERLLLDFNWRFHLGNANDPAKDFGFGALGRSNTYAKSGSAGRVTSLRFDDSAWTQLDLPHDWAVELPFVKEPANIVHHGGKPLGREFPETSIGWYRRTFDLPAADATRRIAVEFDGVFRDATVFFNGHLLGENFSGYAPFRYDVTDLANFGEKNVLTVRVDASLGEGWFYEGAGIYRHVWLTKTDPLHVTQWGTFIKSRVDGPNAAITVETEVRNETDQDAPCRVTTKIHGPDNTAIVTLASPAFTVPARHSHTFTAEGIVPNARLWSLEQRNLYRAESVVDSGGRVTDTDSVAFGIRTIHFDPDKGFFLNGKSVKIKGTCNHQDHAGVGAALPDRLQSFRIEKLQEMSCNGYRTSHNPPTPELLDACDRLGMLVMDETRMMDSTSEGLSELERLIRRDRNHPSVVIWSLGNEEPEQGNSRGARILATMKRLAYELDGTRPVTQAMNNSWGKGASAVVDVQGFNYAGGGGGAGTAAHIDDFHRQFPKQPCIGSETASEVMTRGIYAGDKERGYVSAYDVNFPSYTISAQDWWSIYDERPFLAGGFAWTGFDYRGEPSPYEWPCVSSHFGCMDLCGFPKDTFFFYKSAWTDVNSAPVLHLFPHWNWSDGKEVDVWVYTNLENVELFLNGRSLGSQRAVRNRHLSWKVPFAAGTLEARASRGGKVVLTSKRETAGQASQIALTADRTAISADAEDVSVIFVEIRDAKGRPVPTADNDVKFSVSGPAKIVGVGNGDPSSHEPDKAGNRRAFNGLCCVIVQATRDPGEIRLTASSDGLQSASIAIAANAARPRPFVP